MKSNELLQELQEVNLSYLLLAQHLIRDNPAEAMLRLGVGSDVAEILASLTPAQLMKLANSSMLLCRFRFDDHAILSALTHVGKNVEVSRMHTAILLTQQPLETLQ
ncbi:Flagellar transcriptional activator FlhD [Paraburkholderia caribensis MBA4]|uniref:Flagellar transcriptional regulator FlhD n=1 Tax=Paraburkholderia caribensis MBA4 TaxID=1323664 RepID=A0A0P0RJG8_9BURK|nr:Flagellar transcriptional activator FlhD [Paraburkholderia caribensis MBA4]